MERQETVGVGITQGRRGGRETGSNLTGPESTRNSTGEEYAAGNTLPLTPNRRCEIETHQPQNHKTTPDFTSYKGGGGGSCLKRTERPVA